MSFQPMVVNALDEAWVRIGAHKARKRESEWVQIMISLSGVVSAYLGIDNGDAVDIYRGRGVHFGWIQIHASQPNSKGVKEGITCRRDSKGSALRFRITGRWLGINEPHTMVKAPDVVAEKIRVNGKTVNAVSVELPPQLAHRSIIDPWDPNKSVNDMELEEGGDTDGEE